MGAVQDLVTDRMDVWASAIRRRSTAGRGTSKKLELYGVRKLRELILELAVRGLLVQQDSVHEPASELLKQIAAEKAKLLEEGKIKKDKPLPPIDAEEMPYELPQGWEWVRIVDVGYDFGQKVPSQNFTYVDVGAIDNRLGIIQSPTILSANEAPSRARKIVKNGTIIYSTVRPYLLNIAIVQKDFDPEPIASTAFAVIHPFTNVSSDYVYRYLRSPTFVSYVEGVQTGIAYPAINDKQFFSGLLPLPPTAEQHQIVAKVDELMNLCDELEKQTEASLDAHQTLVTTLLNALTCAADQEHFTSAWQRISAHFDTLITTDDSLDQLKQTILQLAVMGKLVPQDPDDEPADVLLERMKKERKELVKQGILKNLPPLPELDSGKKSIVLPMGWSWGFIPQVVANEKYAIKRGPFGSAIRKDFFVPNGYKVYEQQHAIRDDFSLGDYYIREDKFHELRAFEVKSNDIIISCSGTVGKVAVAPSWMEPGLINQALLKLTLNERALSNDYFKILFPAYYMKTETLSELQGTAQKNMVSVETLKDEAFPLPPLAEQHRIVAKVDALMVLCDQLKARLRDAQITQLHLADALTEKALAEA